MMFWPRWTVLLLGTVLLLVAPVEAGRRPLSDGELDTILAGKTMASPPASSNSTPDEIAEIPLNLGSGRVTRTVRSLKDLRQDRVVLQALDYSCGAAAISTVATYFFGDPIKETDVIAAILVTGQTPQEGIRKYFRRKGFTLLDLKRASETRGYRGTGYRGMTLEDLVETIAEQRAPVLVPINPFGYYHFVVVRGVKGDRVFLADPAVGNMTMKIARFEDVWVDGIGFVLTRPDRRASRTGMLSASAGNSGSIPGTQPAGTNGEPRNGSQTGPSGGVPPMLNLREEEPVPDSSRLLPFMDRAVPSSIPEADHTFDNPQGRRVMSIFVLQNYNAAVQFGRPAGKFVDFSPPPGQPIQITPSASQ